jgi:hypothetical protein
MLDFYAEFLRSVSRSLAPPDPYFRRSCHGTNSTNGPGHVPIATLQGFGVRSVERANAHGDFSAITFSNPSGSRPMKYNSKLFIAKLLRVAYSGGNILFNTSSTFLG